MGTVNPWSGDQNTKLSPIEQGGIDLDKKEAANKVVRGLLLRKTREWEKIQADTARLKQALIRCKLPAAEYEHEIGLIEAEEARGVIRMKDELAELRAKLT